MGRARGILIDRVFVDGREDFDFRGRRYDTEATMVARVLGIMRVGEPEARASVDYRNWGKRRTAHVQIKVESRP